MYRFEIQTGIEMLIYTDHGEGRSDGLNFKTEGSCTRFGECVAIMV